MAVRKKSATSVGALERKLKAVAEKTKKVNAAKSCLLYTSPSPRDRTRSRMPSSA